MQSEADEALITRDAFCVDYAEDIYQNMRESEVR